MKLLWLRRALIPFRRVLRIERAVSSGLCFFLMAALSLMFSTLTQLGNSLRTRGKEKDGTAFVLKSSWLGLQSSYFLALIVYLKIILETWDMPIGKPRLWTCLAGTYLSSYLRGPYLRSQQAMGYNKECTFLFGGRVSHSMLSLLNQNPTSLFELPSWGAKVEGKWKIDCLSLVLFSVCACPFSVFAWHLFS